jgi:hypothetical protein
MGLREILAQEKLDPKDVFHYFVNTAPDRHDTPTCTIGALSL